MLKVISLAGLLIVSLLATALPKTLVSKWNTLGRAPQRARLAPCT